MSSLFDPNSTGSHEQIFGLPFAVESSELVIIPVPWEATTSYGAGTSDGPQAVLNASSQVDLYDIELGEFYQNGIAMLPLKDVENIRRLSDSSKSKAIAVREALEAGDELNSDQQSLQREVNKASQQVNDWVYQTAQLHLSAGKKVALLGGDHSSPYGLIKALSERHRGQFGILHIDAHADLRKSYQGFEHSHASIFRNVMDSEFKPECLVQVGIRDFCKEEYDYIQERSDIFTHFDRSLKSMQFDGYSWNSICESIVRDLPKKVYISFDIDGLSPEFCPNTGTPVPGGLSFDQALSLFAQIRKSGRKIIGFDLNEVSPDPQGSEWDANVGARVLFKLCGYLITEILP